MFEITAVAHSRRVATWYYRQDSHCWIGWWGANGEHSEFNALSPLSKCYIQRDRVYLDVPDASSYPMRLYRSKRRRFRLGHVLF